MITFEQVPESVSVYIREAYEWQRDTRITAILKARKVAQAKRALDAMPEGEFEDFMRNSTEAEDTVRNMTLENWAMEALILVAQKVQDVRFDEDGPGKQLTDAMTAARSDHQSEKVKKFLQMKEDVHGEA